MALGLSCAQLVARRWSLVDVFYAESGAYPRALLGQGITWEAGPFYWLRSTWSLHLAFFACFLVTLAFTLGAGTRYVKWLLLPALFTVDARHPLLFTGGEAVLHGLALYALLLPLGTMWSVDAWLAQRRGPGPAHAVDPTAVVTAVYPLLLAQLAVIYFFCMYAKFGPAWESGQAVRQVLGLSTLVTDFGGWVSHWPTPILRGLSYGTLLIEGTLPLLLLCPWRRRYVHALAGAMMLALHGGIYLAMEVGSFSAAMLCYLPLLWQPRDTFERVVSPSRRGFRLEIAAVLFVLYLDVGRLTHDLILWPKRPILPLPAWLDRVSRLSGVVQPWMMFSPDPPERDFIIVTDAVTRKGLHFDPWRTAASGPSAPLRTLPQSVVKQHVFTRYEGDLTSSQRTYLHPFFSRWVLSQRGPDGEPVQRFDAWLMIVSALPGGVVPISELDARVHVTPLPLPDALPVVGFEAQGVWAPERAFDRRIVPEATYVLTPVGASMSAGCPALTLDLGQPHALVSAYLQADGADYFRLEGSLDGQRFHQLAEMPRLDVGHYRSRVIALPGESVRFVRVRPMKSRGMSHFLSEIALFEHPITLPPLRHDDTHEFISSLARPAVAGILSAAQQPSPECPAESLEHQFADAPRPHAH